MLMETDFKLIREKLAQIRAYFPGLSPATLADKLKISEAELFFAGTDDELFLLKPDFDNLIEELKSLKSLKILTKNKACILESNTGSLNIQPNHCGLLHISNEIMGMEINSENLKFGFVSKTETDNSFRFFDSFGQPVFRLILTSEDEKEAFEEIAKKFKSENQYEEIKIKPFLFGQFVTPTENEISEFKKEWKDLDKVEEFKLVVKKYKLNRFQAIENAPDSFFATKIKNRKIIDLIAEIQQSGLTVKITNENHGCTHSVCSKIEKTAFHTEWFNVFGVGFNWYINTSKIVESRIVRIPSRSGIVTSVECFDGNSELILEICCKTEKDQPESNEWRSLLNQFEQTNF